MSRNRDRSSEIIMNALREAALIRGATEHPESACLTEDVLIGLADGRLTGAELLISTPHLSSCRRCQHELASLVRALNDPAVARAVSADRAYLRRVAQVIIPLAAAATIVVSLAVPRERQSREPVGQHRAPVITPGAAPIIGRPAGVVSDVVDLQWSAVPRAEAYRVTLFDKDGQVVFEDETSENGIVLPDSVTLVPANRYFWQVQARIGFDRWVSSDLVEFRLIPPRP
ncbi:MAG TPA: hypothetical protein VHM24_03160 [Gemmatimonadaceae bacterium]|nr:hypothetical protein [Gemmatimonadaceae bacterium]